LLLQNQTRVPETTVAANTRVSTRITDQCVIAMRDISLLPTENPVEVVGLLSLL